MTGVVPMGGIGRRRCCQLVALLLIAGSGAAFAQLGVELRMDRQHYAQYEKMAAEVTLQNFSGNSMVFSNDQDSGGSLRFSVQTMEGREIMPNQADLNPAAGLIIGPGETKQLRLALNAYYPLQNEGDYVVRARISHPRLRYDFQSETATISVRSGRILWQRQVGLPVDDPIMPIPDRTISLLQLNQIRGGLVCLRVEDSEMVYGLVRLGPIIEGAPAQCEIDAVCNIHVLNPLRPRLYIYRVFDANLELRQTQYYLMEDDTPRLRRDSELGRVRVAGGRIAKEGQDFVLNERHGDRQTQAPASPRVPRLESGEVPAAELAPKKRWWSKAWPF